jgi:hypothetical protein
MAAHGNSAAAGEFEIAFLWDAEVVRVAWGRIIIHQNAQGARPQRTGAHSGYAAYSGTTSGLSSPSGIEYLCPVFFQAPPSVKS